MQVLELIIIVPTRQIDDFEECVNQPFLTLCTLTDPVSDFQLIHTPKVRRGGTGNCIFVERH